MFCVKFSFYYNMEEIASKRRLTAAIIIGFIMILSAYITSCYFRILHYFSMTMLIFFGLVIILFCICMLDTVRRRKVETNGPVHQENNYKYFGLVFLIIPVFVSIFPIAFLNTIKSLNLRIKLLPIFTGMYICNNEPFH